MCARPGIVLSQLYGGLAVILPAVFHVILYEPEIPPNTGNVIRLCANVGASLHLIHPLGFQMDEASLRRAGLDYHELANVLEHQTLKACIAEVNPRRIYALTTTGARSLFESNFISGDAFIFGSETRGLPRKVLGLFPEEAVLRIPMKPGNRSLNVSNCAAIVLYEAWRQGAFRGAR